MRLATGLALAPVFALLGACGGGAGSDSAADGSPVTAAGAATGAATGTTAAQGAAFTATVTGAVDRKVENGNAFAGAKYGRYHINLAADVQPAMVVAFGRVGDAPPTPGRYPLGGNEFTGTLELYGDPQLEFDIVSGELEITGADGDVISGRFSFVARELGGSGGEVRAEGTFRTQPDD